MNGNSGVLKSMMGEITDSTNMAQAFAFMPIVWFVGATSGSVCISSRSVPFMRKERIDSSFLFFRSAFIGGSLSDPYERFTDLFGGLFWKKYPYFLPCLVVAIFPALSCLLVLMMLKEVRLTILRMPEAHPTPTDCTCNGFDASEKAVI